MPCLRPLRSLALVLVFFTLTGLTGCGPARRDRIVVGSKNFTEQAVLGEIFAQQIENHTGLPVERRFYLAGTYICQQAILAGRIDVYPEYTGTALTAVLKEPARSGASEVYDEVKNAYARRFHLLVAPALGFNNTFAIVIRGDDARRLGVSTLSEAARFAPHWRPGFGYEFMERPDGYRGLVKTYSLGFGEQPRIMDLGLLYRALTSDQVDLVAGNSTDGLIAALGLTVLEDDRHYFPPYQAVPVVREDTVRRHPEVFEALEALGGKISEDDMRRLNYAVDGEHRDVRDVVREFLKSRSL
ncbi:MAG TPA: glycine betaine ABC transporter substrate-binding protein [Terriglobia bacterium]